MPHKFTVTKEYLVTYDLSQLTRGFNLKPTKLGFSNPKLLGLFLKLSDRLHFWCSNLWFASSPIYSNVTVKFLDQFLAEHHILAELKPSSCLIDWHNPFSGWIMFIVLGPIPNLAIKLVLQRNSWSKRMAVKKRKPKKEHRFFHSFWCQKQNELGENIIGWIHAAFAWGPSIGCWSMLVEWHHHHMISSYYPIMIQLLSIINQHHHN